ncbi:MAG: carbon monoxide dehydrogenase, partial [Phycisphaerae bacterium]|nr:carbon monoxide dehydrogenase [Phycisphaerae bacterium]
QMFKLNPQVDDVADQYAYRHRGVSLLVLGAIEAGGSGCACPESVLLRALVTDLVLNKDDALVMDMEAGVEHLGRGTARGVNAMVIVVEPGQRSLDSARRVARMAKEIGLSRLRFVGNKIGSPEDERFIRESLPDAEFVGMIPFAPSLRSADRAGRSVLDGMDAPLRAVFEGILGKLEE